MGDYCKHSIQQSHWCRYAYDPCKASENIICPIDQTQEQDLEDDG